MFNYIQRYYVYLVKIMEIVKLLEYDQFLRHSYLEAISKLSWEEVVKNREASFNSLRNIYLHSVSVMDFYVNHILQGDATYPRINYDDYNNIETINTYLEHVESNVNAYLERVTSLELSRKIERKQRDGSTITMTVEDVLIDLFQEGTHHRGELIALLWQMDVRPPHISWSRYLSSRKP